MLFLLTKLINYDIMSEITHYRFLIEKEYVESFTSRGETVPPFLVFLPYEIRDNVPGYLIPCSPDHPDAEEAVNKYRNAFPFWDK